ncbi:MAG: hypothetical protein HQ523_02320 [Lentisphaerae bacterium]|nr:hypothetical protein [Lentisphaerota bacterium]
MSCDDPSLSNSELLGESHLIVDLAWLVGLLLIVDGGGFFGTLVGRFLGAVLCASVLWLFPVRCPSVSKSAIIAAFFLVFLYVSNVVVVLGLAVAFALCCWRTGRGYRPLALATTSLFALRSICFFVPELHSGLAVGCYRLTDWLSSLTPLPCRLGPTYMGLDAIILCSAYAVGVVRSISNPSAVLAAMTAFTTGLLASLLSVVLHSCLPSIVAWFHRHIPFGSVAAHRHVEFSVLMTFVPLCIPFIVVPLFCALRALTPKKNQESEKGSDFLSYPRQWPVLYLSTVLIALVLCLLQQERWSFAKDRKKQVCFVDAGLMDFRLPAFGRTGHANVGMFGLFEKCLKETGRTVTHIPSLSVLDTAKPQPDVLVMINPTGVVEQAAHKLHEYLAEGGSLLLLGDHTDIAGTQASLNHILTPLGASFRFDSGFPAGRAWPLRYGLPLHRLTVPLDFMNQGLQWSTGATLDLGTVWFPLLIGKYVFSDVGNRLNAENAFLGDYRYQPGELLGDVILAAERSIGNGRIIVFGDTTSFQNLAVVRTWPFLDRLIAHLAGRSHAQGLLVMVVSVCVMLPLVILLFGNRQWRLMAVSIIVLATIVSELLARRPWQVKIPNLPVALVDVDHANRLHLDHWRNDSIDGLLVNLVRNGFWPVLSSDQDIEHIKRPVAEIIIDPRKPWRVSELANWERDLAAGRTLLFAIGYPVEPSLQRWLLRQGLRINSEPLGPIPLSGREAYEKFKQRSRTPQFSEAWGVDFQNAAWVSRYTWEGRHIVCERSVGPGSLIVIADPLFLLDRTLEAEKEAWPGNIQLLSSLLRNRCGDVDR